MSNEFIIGQTSETSEVDKAGEISEVSEPSLFRNRETVEKFSVREAREVANDTYDRAVEQLMVTKGEYLSEQGFERLEAGVDHLDVVEPNENSRTIGTFSFHEGSTTITVCAINKEQVERTTQHEVNHFASYNKEIQVEPSDEGMEGKQFMRTSGIREYEYYESPNGSVCMLKDSNRGFNEGITQMYTIRQLRDIDEQKGINALRQNGYAHATELVEQVEEAVGEEVISRAYYGGDLKGLEDRLDEMGGKGTFDTLSRCMDEVTYSSSYIDRMIAMRDANEVLASISEGGQNEDT